jgi:hypothetical protein
MKEKRGDGSPASSESKKLRRLLQTPYSLHIWPIYYEMIYAHPYYREPLKDSIAVK